MSYKSQTRRLTKSAAKKVLKGTKKTLTRNKNLKKMGKAMFDIMFPGYGTVYLYDYARYSPTITMYQNQQKQSKSFTTKPLISIILPTYNTPIDYLTECIDSVIVQSYPNWELCIADDASKNKDVVQTIHQYMKKEKRIKLVEREQNGHISLASNSALDIAKGEYVALLDHDDVLWPNALFEVVKCINDNPKVDLIYSDEDKIDEEGKIHSYPFFKPDWSPEFLEACNYITHFMTIRSSVVKELGGFKKGYEGAQDWDLILRVSERTDNISHISKILYSWRIHEASTASDTEAKPYVYQAQQQLLEDHIKRLGLKGEVKVGAITQHCRIEYGLDSQPVVSLILYNVDTDIKKSLLPLIKNAEHKEIEIILLVDNTKAKRQAARLLGKRFDYKLIDLVDNNIPKTINLLAGELKGEYLAFVDSSTTTITHGWLQLLLGDAQLKGVGAVGGRTLSSDRDRFLRAGIGLGIYGLYASLLEWMASDDIHYLRGLYGQSRRNVAAIDSGILLVSKKSFDMVKGFDENMDNMFIVDFCLKLLNSKYRNVYNPAVTTIDQHNVTNGDAGKLHKPASVKAFKDRWAKYIAQDPYLNEHFTKTNEQLEIK